MPDQIQPKIRSAMPSLLGGSLVKRIIVALILGAVFAYALPKYAAMVGILGTLFVSALKAVAPLLVFLLVTSAIANQDLEAESHMKPIVVLYLTATFFAALASVTMSFAYPVSIKLAVAEGGMSAPGAVSEVLKNLVLSVVDNPVKAIANANYIGIIAWAVGLGFALRKSSENTRRVVSEISGGVEFIVRIVISCAPIGIFGLVSHTFSTEGFGALLGYAQLLIVLIGAMILTALVLNPIIVFICTHKNPYPLILLSLRESGVTAFFTRSSAANIPVNLSLCRRLHLDESTYSVSIPLGATINMSGAAITVTVLTLAACNNLGIQVSFGSALLLSLVASLCACGAAGVPGGSLMLIPLACGLFGIDNNTAMQVVAVGFIIGVLQDSAETALNSSSDVVLTAAACMRAQRLKGEKITSVSDMDKN